MGISGIGIWQFFYLVPAWRNAESQDRKFRAIGIKIGAVITILIEGGCWSMALPWWQ